MKKVCTFIFVIITVVFYSTVIISARPCDIKVWDGGGGSGGYSSPKIVNSGLKAEVYTKDGTLLESGVGNYQWDIYVRSTPENCIVVLSDKIDLFLYSDFYGTIPVYGVAEFLNGIINYNYLRFRLTVSPEIFVASSIDVDFVGGITVYNADIKPDFLEVVYNDGTKDKISFYLFQSTNIEGKYILVNIVLSFERNKIVYDEYLIQQNNTNNPSIEKHYTSIIEGISDVKLLTNYTNIRDDAFKTGISLSEIDKTIFIYKFY